MKNKNKKTFLQLLIPLDRAESGTYTACLHAAWWHDSASKSWSSKCSFLLLVFFLSKNTKRHN